MKLKPGKACGPEGISAEHLKWGGDSLYLWLLGIVNAILEIEEISSLDQFAQSTRVAVKTLSLPIIIVASL